MRWFGRRAEERADEDLAPAEAIDVTQAGRPDGGWLRPRRYYPGASAAAQTGAAEMCADWWSRALSSAAVTGDLARVVTPPMLAQVGRSLIREGEWLGLIEVRGGEVCLTPAAAQWSEGRHDPSQWGYHLTLRGPSSSVIVRARPDQVVHLKWAETPGQPWRGLSPLHLASQTARRAFMSEARLADLAAAEVREHAVFTFTKALSDTARRQFLEMWSEHMAGPEGAEVPVVLESGGEMDTIGWGLSPEDADIENAKDVLATMAAACGIPTALVAGTDGSAATVRENYRTFLFGAVQPRADLLLHELRSKLDSPDMAMAFDEMRAADIAGRARAYASLVKAGYKPAQAAMVSGLPIEGAGELPQPSGPSMGQHGPSAADPERPAVGGDLTGGRPQGAARPTRQ